MRLLFLGSGSAFTVGGGNFQSNMLLTSDSGRHLLLDCGSDIRFCMHEQGLLPSDLHDIYISHLHADHAGGLEYVGFSTLFDPSVPRPRLFLPRDLVGPLWEHTLLGGMGLTEHGEATLSTYFDVHPVDDSFEWEGISLRLVRTDHVVSARHKMHSHGLMLLVGQRRIFITTDTRHTPELLAPHYEQADLVFHDCETSPFRSGVHAHYDELAQLSEATRKKTWLYHYQPGPLPDHHAAGFLGFVKPGQSFVL